MKLSDAPTLFRIPLTRPTATLPMNWSLVEARSPLRATFVSGEGTRRHHQRFMVQVHARSGRRLSMHEVGTRSTASVFLRRKCRTRWNASLPNLRLSTL